MWESMNKTGVYKCPYSMQPENYSESRTCYIRCAGHESHKMYSGEASNVIEKFCDGDFENCNHYKKYEEDKQMSKIQEYSEENQLSIIKAEENTAVTNSYKKAYSIHIEVKTNGELAEKALLNMCKGLKQIRDEELFKELGYTSFEDYVENNGDYSIKSRQAYTYISTYEKLGPAVLQSNANAGITKLSLLAEVPGYERAEFLENHDLENESVSQLKAELEKYKQKAEQLDFFEEEKEKAKITAETAEEQLKVALETKQEFEDRLSQMKQYYEDNHKKLHNELAELKAKPVEVAVAEPSAEQIAEIKAQATADAQAEFDLEKKKLAEEKNELNIQLKKEFEDKLQLEHQKAEQEKQALEKKLKVGTADESLIAFKLYFANVQEDFKKFIGVIDTVEDIETKAKFKGAVVKYLNMMLADLESEVK